MDFSLSEDEQVLEDELVFDGPEQAEAEAEPAPAPIAEEPAKPGRKRSAKAKAAPEPVIDDDMAMFDEMLAAELEPVPAPAAALPEPAIEAPAPPPVAVAATAMSRPLKIVAALTAVASLFSAVGLLVTMRSLAALDVGRAAVARQEAALARLPQVLAEVERLTARQREELDRAARTRPADIVTRAELTRQIDGLRFAVARSQAPGTTALAGVVRAGQTELADRIDALHDRVDKIQSAKAGRAAAHR